MTPRDYRAAALALLDAEATRRQIGLLSLAHPGMTLDDAYAVQADLVALKVAAGRHRVGWKIGLTSRAMQEALQIDTPDSGVLLDDMVFQDGATIPKNRFIQPRVEAEIAFVMKHDLAGPEVSVEQVYAATDYVQPAIEIIDKKGDFYPDSIAGERITTATVALSEYGVAPSTGCVWLKGWSENEGLPERLQEIGVVRLTGRAAPCGYAVAQEGELTPAGLAAIACFEGCWISSATNLSKSGIGSPSA